MSKTTESQFATIEEAMLTQWAKEKTFEKSLEQRKGRELFSFYDGPPFANGLPHFGHSLVTSIKDAVLRYKTMRGYYVPRRNGWDCHGLPVEFSIEKELGISGKKQILELGLDKFNAACRDSIFRYKDEWERLLKRLGRWSEYDNYYATVDSTYTESVWWALKQINDKGLLYRGLKSTPYCPRCETPLSNFELNEGYKDNVPDPSVFVLFRLTEESTRDLQQQLGGNQKSAGSASRTVSLLAWTTTPWTLPANTALAVDKDADYAFVKLKSDDSTLVLAKERLDVLDLRKHDYSVLKTVKGKNLIGLHYQPLYDIDKSKYTKQQLAKAWQVFATDYASFEEGSGIVHTGTPYGEVDLDLILKEGLPLVKSVDASGHLIFGSKAGLGKFFKDADRDIVAELTKEGRIFAAETAEHTYPFCWRCDTPLMYYANTTWFVAVSQIRQQMLKTAEQISWVPDHIKHGRFGKWLESARDWAVSRNRYWGAPMPIWVNEKDENDYLVVDSYKELRELSGDAKLDMSDVHRPGIDKVVIKKDGNTYRRVEEVLDCWFESGCMSLGQQHYPFENNEAFQATFPADFIIEGLDQTRLWFYVQHVVATILFNQPAFKNVVVNGIILAADGQKLSKRLKNYPPVGEVFDDEGADALRLFLLSSTQATQTADYMRFNRDALKDLKRNILDTLLNSFNFFKLYADIDKWRPPKTLKEPEVNHVLDRWLLARLNQTIAEVTKQADAYKLAYAIQPIFQLIDDTSNWYVRRSRRRFWKSQDDEDKNTAYAMLHYALVRTSQLLAPWAPFVSDYLWRELTKSQGEAKSVHLTDWPAAGQVDKEVIADMAKARDYIVTGLAQRAAAKLKVRQPLAAVTIPGLPEAYQPIVAEELNVKEVRIGKKVHLDTDLTPELKREGLMRDLVRQVQTVRKQAGLEVSDRIDLVVESEDRNLKEALKRYSDTIKSETLALTLNKKANQVDQSWFVSKEEIQAIPTTISVRRSAAKQ